MKFIVLGLGNFGSELSIKLTELGHEVIGVDSNMKRVEFLQDSITHTICMDTTDESGKQLKMTTKLHTILGAGGTVSNQLLPILLGNKERVRLVSRKTERVQGAGLQRRTR